MGMLEDDLDYALRLERSAPATHHEYLVDIVERALLAAKIASVKFPQPNYVTLKVAEEAGEVVRASVHYAEGRLSWQELENEAVQLLAMVFRLLTEGDQVNGVKPPPR